MSNNTDKNKISERSERIANQLTAFFDALAKSNAAKNPHDAQNPQTPRTSVLAAVSGGADSVALIHMLAKFREKLNIEKLAVAHVNHGMRGEESNDDEKFVKSIAENLNVEFFCKRLENLSLDDTGVEEIARQKRYEFFAEVAAANGYNYIATAHTANDQAETLLMRLVRGANVRGLRGIHAVRADGVIRPLLQIERGELEEWLRLHGLTYREDSSNADDKFRRNFLRNNVMPLLMQMNSAAIRNIAASATAAEFAWDHVSAITNEWINKYVLRINEDAFHIEKIGFAESYVNDNENSVINFALAVLFDEYGIDTSRLHIGRVIDVVDNNKNSGVYLFPNNWKLYPRDDRICFVRET